MNGAWRCPACGRDLDVADAAHHCGPPSPVDDDIAGAPAAVRPPCQRRGYADWIAGVG